MKFKLEPYNRNNTDRELLTDLKRVAKEINKNTITIEDYSKLGKFHPATIQRRFGGWLFALEKANLKKSRNYNISDEDLFKNIEELWIKLGRQPFYSNLKESKFGATTYTNRFGGWRKALEAFIEYINNENVILGSGELKKVSTENVVGLKKQRTKRNINWRLRFIVLRKDEFKCRICGKSPATDPKIVLHVDHVLAWAKGGETLIDNLQTLCSICNIGKSDLGMKE